MNISIYSRKAIEELLKTDKFPSKSAVISFFDPHDTPVEYEEKTDKVYYVPIHDIDIEILGDYGFTYDTFFPEVKELAEFILDVESKGYDIICQCEYGQSRSAGCAAAIQEFFYKSGIQIFANYSYYPNQVIYNKVYEALVDKQNMKNTT